MSAFRGGSSLQGTCKAYRSQVPLAVEFFPPATSGNKASLIPERMNLGRLVRKVWPRPHHGPCHPCSFPVSDGHPLLADGNSVIKEATGNTRSESRAITVPAPSKLLSSVVNSSAINVLLHRVAPHRIVFDRASSKPLHSILQRVPLLFSSVFSSLFPHTLLVTMASPATSTGSTKVDAVVQKAAANAPGQLSGIALYSRFALAGAICCSVTHGALTPVDVYVASLSHPPSFSPLRCPDLPRFNPLQSLQLPHNSTLHHYHLLTMASPTASRLVSSSTPLPTTAV